MILEFEEITDEYKDILRRILKDMYSISDSLESLEVINEMIRTYEVDLHQKADRKYIEKMLSEENKNEM